MLPSHKQCFPALMEHHSWEQAVLVMNLCLRPARHRLAAESLAATLQLLAPVGARCLASVPILRIRL